MKKLSMTDAFMLAVETATQRLEMASVSILSPSNGTEQITRQLLHDRIDERIHLAPILRRKLVNVPFGLDFPYWADEPSPDLNHHVREVRAPSPGDDRALAELVTEIVSQPLDRTRPLWELYLITGLEGGRRAIMFKLHHAAVDGISGLRAHSVLFDQPLPTPLRHPAMPAGELVPSNWDLLTKGLSSLPDQVLRAVRGGARSVPYLDHLMPFRVVPGAGTLSGTVRRVARLSRIAAGGDGLDTPKLRVPGTRCDRPPLGQRRWAFTRVPLDEVKRLKAHYGVTVNDVIVATTAGAVRDWFTELGELPDEPLVALVPMSVRSADATEDGNHVQVMLVELRTDELDPESMLRRTHQTLRLAKARQHAVPLSAIEGANDLVLPALFLRASRAASRLAGLTGATANAVISNVPGPSGPVAVFGERVEAIYPVGGVVEGFGFSVIVFSYDGELNVGFVVDASADADPWQLAHAYDRSHRELLKLVR
ncbi:wax ester/triacylglycerol synthase family O-acyltransferase [Nocardia sp. NPDC059236]